MKDLNKIKLFAMDVDGTLTDGRIYMGNNGESMKAFNAKDGLGIKLLMSRGIIPVIITGRASDIVMNRMKEIGISEIYQNVKNKGEVMRELIKKYKLNKDQVSYIGDDMNDLSAIKEAGVTFAPADCAESLKPYIDILLTKNAGDASVREAADMIMGDFDFDGFLDI
jgi:3-deoxy-D-manno-octulosonate 8-phosphate phosphatase (KDO 8-P phosphatase)